MAGAAAMFSAYYMLKQQEVANADNKKTHSVYGWGSSK
jgi:hypothetical protein